MKVNLHTSVDDLLSSFKCSIERYAVKDFENAIAEEEKMMKRKTVIKLLRRAMRMKKQKARCI